MILKKEVKKEDKKNINKYKKKYLLVHQCKNIVEYFELK